VEVDGQVFHRLLAGTAGSVPAVEDVRASLGETFGASNAERWILRNAGQAYLLGGYPTETEAAARLDDLEGRGIDAYVLEVPEGDTGRYRVYAGGYANAAESVSLRALLDEAGVADTELVDRVGRMPR